MKKQMCKGVLLFLLVGLNISVFSGFSTLQSGSSGNTSTLTISAAASLKDVLTEANRYFAAANSDIKVVVNYGGSGALEKQIEAGAPVDIFISADTKNVKKLDDKGMIQKDSIKDIAGNKLVLVAYANNSFRIRNINDLAKPEVKPIGIGALGSVPAGDYAKEVLTYYHLWDKISSKLVYAKDVTQVLSYVKAGNTMAGFVYLTDARKKTDAIIKQVLPEESHSPILYEGGVVGTSSNTAAAKKYMDFLMGERAQAIFQKLGFTRAAKK